MIVGDLDQPAPAGRLPGDREIAAKVDQHPTSNRVVSAARGAVGRERLGGRPEVELDAWRKLDASRPLIQSHRPPSPDDGCAHAYGLIGCLRDRREVAVVADRPKRSADRRVEDAVRRLGGTERHGDRLDEQPAGANGTALRAVESRELRVRPKPAAGEVDRRELLLEDTAGSIQCRSPE